MLRAVSLRMRITIGLNLLLAGVLLAPAARADRRTLIRAYEYMTQPKDNLELEIWNDVAAPADGGFDAASTVHRIELEYGLTDHWDLALYHVFAQSPGESFKFDSWRVENRYRLAEKGEWPGDRPGDADLDLLRLDRAGADQRGRRYQQTCHPIPLCLCAILIGC